MSYLLDTHCFLWSLFAPGKLSRHVQAVIADPSSAVAVSSVTFWEIALKHAMGKLELERVAPEELPAAAKAMNLDLLPLDAETAAGFARLPRDRHKDPFDRMLVWQAIRHSFVLISHDSRLDGYRASGLRTLR